MDTISTLILVHEITACKTESHTPTAERAHLPIILHNASSQSHFAHRSHPICITVTFLVDDGNIFEARDLLIKGSSMFPDSDTQILSTEVAMLFSGPLICGRRLT